MTGNPNATELRAELKQMMVQDLMLKVAVEDLADDLPLFGPGGLGLDSVDALQLVVALDKNYGLKIGNPQEARDILRTVSTIADAVASHAGRVVAPSAA
jgi:acyl carrier protein